MTCYGERLNCRYNREPINTQAVGLTIVASLQKHNSDMKTATSMDNNYVMGSVAAMT